MTSPTTTPTDPEAKAWLTEARRSQIMSMVGGSRTLLQQAGLWRATLGYWVRWQASLEAKWPKEEEEKYVNKLLQKWHESNKESKTGIGKLGENVLREKIRVSPAVEVWSRDQWGHRLDSLFLQRKDQLDQASCRLLRIKEKRIASELYYRIKNSETSFAKAAYDFSEGPERENGGLIPLRSLETMPFGLAPLLQHLEPNKVSQPMRLAKGYCLVELLEYRPSRLNKKIETVLLAEQLRLWIDSVVDVLEADLQWEGD